MNPIVEFKNVSKTFYTKNGPFQALNQINLAIQEGDIFGIIGLSGAGKSTLVRCINYLEVPTEGEVRIAGRDLGKMNQKELRRQRQEIGMIFQNFNLLMQRNVLDNICFPLEIAGVKKADARKRAEELLEIVGLSDKAKSYPSQLSGGQKLFGADTRTRLRPSYFPFTEPSVEVDVSCFECHGKGCPLCKHTGWIEVLGGGVVNRKVLENCNIDPDEYSGFAFGIGIERIAMLKYGINNIGLMFENNLQFLKQFHE